MSSYWDIYFHLKTLHIFGLLCCQYNKDASTHAADQLIITKSNEIQALLACGLVHLGLIIMLVYCLVHNREFHLATYNRTGNQYFSVNFVIGCILLSSIYLYFYINRKRIVKLLLLILNYHKTNCNKRKQNSETWSFRLNYILYVVISAMCSYIYLTIFIGSHLTPFATSFYSILFISQVVICGLVLLVYVFMVKILQFSLKHLNLELYKLILRNSPDNLKDFKDLLRKRNELLAICYWDLCRNYGFIILMIVTYVIITAPSGPFYFITVVLESSRVEPVLNTLITLVVSLSWNVPWIVVFCTMGFCGGINEESKNTTKILLRYRCCKSAKNKIIDKFLMKNLQQKPILTACDFFALEKRTLFQLLASIFTYMMILVQFKDLENGTRPSD